MTELYTHTELETTLDLLSDIETELKQSHQEITIQTIINHLHNLTGRNE